MRYLHKAIHALYLFYAFTLFVGLMLPVFVVALLAIPLGAVKGGNLIFLACRLWADVWLALIFIRHQNIYLHKPVKHQSYIFVLNHISYLDSALIPKVFRRAIRPLGKVEISRVPLFGTIYKRIIVSVDRSSAANRARSILELKEMLRREISVLVFPEGTFNETGLPLKKFYDGAFRLALETGTPIMPVLFLDNYSRMHYSSVFTLNPGKTRAVFLNPVDVVGKSMDDLPTLKEEVIRMMEAKLLEYKAPWINVTS